MARMSSKELEELLDEKADEIALARSSLRAALTIRASREDLVEAAEQALTFIDDQQDGRGELAVPAEPAQRGQRTWRLDSAGTSPTLGHSERRP